MPRYFIERRITQDLTLEVEAESEQQAQAIANATHTENWNDHGTDDSFEVFEIE